MALVRGLLAPCPIPQQRAPIYVASDGYLCRRNKKSPAFTQPAYLAGFRMLRSDARVPEEEPPNWKAPRSQPAAQRVSTPPPCSLLGSHVHASRSVALGGLRSEAAGGTVPWAHDCPPHWHLSCKVTCEGPDTVFVEPMSLC